MGKRIYSLSKIQKEKARMEKRCQRGGIRGKTIEISAGGTHITCLSYLDSVKPECGGYRIVEVHGGGFMYNTAWDDDDLCSYIHEKTGIPVLACNYRLTPEYPYPAGLDDVCRCIRAAAELPTGEETYFQSGNTKPVRIILWGHSAGANLAATAAARILQNRESCLPDMMILDYPYMDVWKSSSERKKIPCSVPGKLMDTFASFYAQNEKRRDSFISPTEMPAEKLRGMPDTFLLLCGRDNLQAGGEQYGELLRSAGCRVDTYHVEKALHGFIENYFNFRNISLLTRLQMTGEQKKLAASSVDEICSWIEQHRRQPDHPVM